LLDEKGGGRFESDLYIWTLEQGKDANHAEYETDVVEDDAQLPRFGSIVPCRGSVEDSIAIFWVRNSHGYLVLAARFWELLENLLDCFRYPHDDRVGDVVE
jgi:hypothetical protein